MLLVAGNETTRNTIAHGLRLLTTTPTSASCWLSDFDRYIGGAIEEMVRYVLADHPVPPQRHPADRAARRDLKPGDQVALFYGSANRDEEVFDDPDRFDITRAPNPHVGFGGPGPHFCLGANLARKEITIMFRELFTRIPDIRAVGEPELLLSNFDNAVKRQPFTFGRH